MQEEKENKTEKKEATYSADTSVYLERALSLQKKKIERQTLELARMNLVYKRDVRNAKIRDAFRFLIAVILKKIKR